MLYHGVLVIAVAVSCQAYKAGPPVNHAGICVSMAPNTATDGTGHGAAPSDNAASPFEITVSNLCYKSGQQVSVRLADKSGTDNEIEGLFVQARRATGNDMVTPVGTFQPVNYAKTQLLKCTADNDAVGHKDEPKLASMDFNWSPPATDVGPVKFRVTIVETKVKYWVGLESPEIKYDAACAENIAAKPLVTCSLIVVSAILALVSLL